MSKSVQVSDHRCNLGRVAKRATPTSNGNVFAYGAVVIPENPETSTPAKWQNIKAFGSTAQSLTKLLPGARMIVWGTESPNEYMHEGEKKLEMVLTITKFQVVPTNEFAKT